MLKFSAQRLRLYPRDLGASSAGEWRKKAGFMRVV